MLVPESFIPLLINIWFNSYKLYTLLTKSWSKLVKIGRHWSKYVFGQGDSDDQYPKGPPLVT